MILLDKAKSYGHGSAKSIIYGNLKTIIIKTTTMKTKILILFHSLPLTFWREQKGFVNES
jgi:hypothetical protein